MPAEKSPLELKIEANAGRVIEQSLNDEGPLTEYFSKVREGIRSKLTATNEFKKSRGKTDVLSAEDIEKQTNARLDEFARKQVKEALVASSKGDSHAGIDLGAIGSLVKDGQSVAANLSAFNPLGIIASVMSLLGNSLIGDYVSAAVKLFTGKPETRPQSFADALALTKMEKGLAAFAKETGAGLGDLKSELLAESPAPANDNPVAHPEASSGMIVPVPPPTPGQAPAPSNKAATPPK
jgi:hypothetical protein